MRENKILNKQHPPILTLFEVERISVFQNLVKTLMERKKEYGALFCLGITEAIQLQALLSYTDNVYQLSKVTGIPKKDLELIKIQNFEQFFDNIFKQRSDEALIRTFGLEEKADKIIDTRLEDPQTTAIQAANISKIFFEKRIKKEEMAIKRKEAEKANSTVNVNVQYGDAELNSRIADLEKRIAFTEGREIKKIAEAEVLDEPPVPV